jgi:hypothetical protein
MDVESSIIRHERVGQGEGRVHDWRVFQLKRLGVPSLLAESYADSIDWHQVARLVQRGCPPLTALRIVR